MSLRRPGIRLTPSERLAYGAALRELYAADPGATIEQAIAKTGAPRGVVEDVRGRLITEGKLQPRQHTRRALLVKP